MRKVIKAITIVMVIAAVTSTLIGSNLNINLVCNGEDVKSDPAKVAVIVYNTNDPYMSEILRNLNDIQKENAEKVEFTIYNSNENQATQDEIIDTILNQNEYKLLMVALVDINSSSEVINRVKGFNIPIILFQREPYSKEAISSYEKAIFIGTYTEQAGIIQGQIIVDDWNINKEQIDKNKDDIMQYVMIKGRIESLDTINRSKYSVLTIKDAGINEEELASMVANWNEEQAKELTNRLLLRYGNRIEVIIANNDAMAIGAIEALQSFGYNNGNMDRTIPVVGVDAIPEARKLVNDGIMTGTVIQDAHGMAEALYSTGMNLIEKKNPLAGTKYEFDETEVTIRLPYNKYIPS